MSFRDTKISIVPVGLEQINIILKTKLVTSKKFSQNSVHDVLHLNFMQVEYLCTVAQFHLSLPASAMFRRPSVVRDFEVKVLTSNSLPHYFTSV